MIRFRLPFQWNVHAVVAGAALALFAAPAGADVHRFTATVNYAGATATDVPAALRISETLVPGFDYAAAGDGTHFEIADENGAILPYEIDTRRREDRSHGRGRGRCGQRPAVFDRQQRDGPSRRTGRQVLGRPRG